MNYKKTNDINSKSEWTYSIDEQDTIDNLRNIGYELEEAIGDIVDNSIDAGATKIFIEYHFRNDNNQGYVAVLDNGVGMNKDQLTEAFSFKKNKKAKQNRLGFFGFGLKTASMSQCDKLSILTKSKNGELQSGTVNYNNKNRVIHEEFDDPNNLKTILDGDDEKTKLPIKFSTGTIVMWSEMNERLGRVLKEKNHIKNFVDISSRIEGHLSLIFSELIKENKIQIFVGRNNWNNNPIKCFDPFLTAEQDTIELPEEQIKIDDLEGKISIKPFILPDISSFTEEKREAITSFFKWNDMQGIYIYRNNRLLSFGQWHSLRYKNKLLKESSDKFRNLRIKVLFNDLKNLEKLDLTINKSKMKLPTEVYSKLSLRLEGIIDNYHKNTNLSKIKKIFIYKGKDQSLWKKNSNESLEIDKSHPIIKDLIEQNENNEKFKQLLTILNQQQKEHNLINIVLKYNDPNYSNDQILISQMKDQYRQLKENKILDEKDILEILKSLFEGGNQINDDYIKNKVIADE